MYQRPLTIDHGFCIKASQSSDFDTCMRLHFHIAELARLILHGIHTYSCHETNFWDIDDDSVILDNAATVRI